MESGQLLLGSLSGGREVGERGGGFFKTAGISGIASAIIR